jgi:hypothetical protein
MPLKYSDRLQPCEECGTILAAGVEPNSPQGDLEAWEAGETEIRTEVP